MLAPVLVVLNLELSGIWVGALVLLALTMDLNAVTGGGNFSTAPSTNGTVNGFGGKNLSFGGAVGVQAIEY
jgi:hypothetical protein